MAAQTFLNSLQTLQGFIADSPNPALYTRSDDALRQCKECVEEEFELEIAGGRRGKKRTARELSLMKQLRYYKLKVRRLENDQVALQRRGNEISKHILVKVGLSDPGVNSRQLKGMLAEDDVSAISHTYIGKVRDAFAETLKGMAKEHLKKIVGCMPGRSAESSAEDTFFLLQIHDEASMRFRSFDRVAVPAFGHDGQGTVFSRGRLSSIQNNAVHLYVGSVDAELPWFTELQPLARKDGPTVATVVKRVADGICLLPQCPGSDKQQEHAVLAHPRRGWNRHKRECRETSLAALSRGVCPRRPHRLPFGCAQAREPPVEPRGFGGHRGAAREGRRRERRALRMLVADV